MSDDRFGRTTTSTTDAKVEKSSSKLRSKILVPTIFFLIIRLRRVGHSDFDDIFVPFSSLVVVFHSNRVCITHCDNVEGEQKLNVRLENMREIRCASDN